jgi:hypothetical protein
MQRFEGGGGDGRVKDVESHAGGGELDGQHSTWGAAFTAQRRFEVDAAFAHEGRELLDVRDALHLNERG